MRRVFWPFLIWIVLSFLYACKSDRPTAQAMDTGQTEEAAMPVDSATDTLEVEEVPPPPPAADGLFDDFIYNFMRSKKFQFSRIRFPLANRTDGVDNPIRKSQWKMDRMYAENSTYTMIFNSHRATQSEKDTSLHHVVVEWIYLEEGRVKQYIFEKLQGQWQLTALDRHAFENHPNSDFYSFYQKFATDTQFQEAHILQPFNFKTYDYDSFEEIEGTLDVSQWPDYRPELPNGTITNIIYGKPDHQSNYRALVISSPSAGMNCTLEFVKKDGEWMLSAMEN